MFNCKDCSVDTLQIGEYYMVHKEVWKQTQLDPDGGCLCVDCLEARLGRSLTSKDFPELPVNTTIHFPKSTKILSRMNNEI